MPVQLEEDERRGTDKMAVANDDKAASSPNLRKNLGLPRSGEHGGIPVNISFAEK